MLKIDYHKTMIFRYHCLSMPMWSIYLIPLKLMDFISSIVSMKLPKRDSP